MLQKLNVMISLSFSFFETNTCKTTASWESIIIGLNYTMQEIHVLVQWRNHDLTLEGAWTLSTRGGG